MFTIYHRKSPVGLMIDDKHENKRSSNSQLASVAIVEKRTLLSEHVTYKPTFLLDWFDYLDIEIT